MGTRRHNELYPSYSVKNWVGPMPKWIKKFRHTQERRTVRQAIVQEEDIPKNYKDIKGRTTCMWY